MAFLHPSKIVDRLNIVPGAKAADFGCGSGHFAVEMAKRAGNSGRVYAFDIQPEVLSALKSKVAFAHLSNVEMRRADLETAHGTQLAENLLDFVLLCNVLFQVENKNAVAEESFRILKQGGRAAVIDWKPKAGGLGPPEELRAEKEGIKDIFLKQGFVLDREFETDDFHYGLIFKKPSE